MIYEDYQKLYEEKLHTVDDALALIHSGDIVFTTNNYSEPGGILSRLHEIAPRVEDVRVWKGRSGIYPFMNDPAMKGHIGMYTYFFGPLFYKESQPMGLVEYVPADLQSYFTTAVSGHQPTLCMTAVAPMDEQGFFRIPMNHVAEGLTIADAVARGVPVVVEVNRNLRPAHGAQTIHIRDVAMIVEADRPELIIPPMQSTEVEERIGGIVAELVNDGDTIQLGIGGIPNAVGGFLRERNDLGIHTEMFTTSMMELIQAGNITGMKKSVDRGLHTFSFAEGIRELYPFISEHEECVIRPARDHVDPFVIAQQDNMTSINTLVEIDLTGQVCAESIGPKQIAGAGGAFCFAYGTYRAKGGKNILAFPSRTKNGQSKIKCSLTQGAIVTVPRNYVDIIVTEYGVACLRGRTIRERAEQLIAIAHPDDRAALTAEARKWGLLP